MLVERAKAWWDRRIAKEEAADVVAGLIQFRGAADYLAFEALYRRVRKLHGGFPRAHSMAVTQDLVRALEAAGYRLTKAERQP